MTDFLLADGGPVLTKGSIRLRENPNDRLTFQFNPGEVEVVSTATWVKQKIPGKHHPILQYAGGDGRTITFKLKLYSTQSGGDDVDAQVAWLQGLTYPDIRGNELTNREPPRCILFLGRFYKVFNVVVESAKVVNERFYRNLNTAEATIEIVCLEDEPNAVGYRELRSAVPV